MWITWHSTEGLPQVLEHPNVVRSSCKPFLICTGGIALRTERPVGNHGEFLVSLWAAQNGNQTLGSTKVVGYYFLDEREVLVVLFRLQIPQSPFFESLTSIVVHIFSRWSLVRDFLLSPLKWPQNGVCQPIWIQMAPHHRRTSPIDTLHRRFAQTTRIQCEPENLLHYELKQRIVWSARIV